MTSPIPTREVPTGTPIAATATAIIMIYYFLF